jgi:tetratricopeptide (TPR) repeat protein
MSSSSTVSEAIRLYTEAGRLFRENKRIAKSAAKRFPEQTEEAKRDREPPGSWIDTAAGNASEIARLLKGIIALGEEDTELRRHHVYALAHRNLGLYFSRRFNSFQKPFPGYMEEAADHLNTALSLGIKRDGKVARTLGAAYFQSGRFREAVGPLKESIEANPKDGTARYQLCLTHLCLHEPERAREQYEALKQNPESPDYQLAKMLEPMMERQRKPLDEAEQQELRREVEKFRRIRE